MKVNNYLSDAGIRKLKYLMKVSLKMIVQNGPKSKHWQFKLRMIKLLSNFNSIQNVKYW